MPEVLDWQRGDPRLALQRAVQELAAGKLVVFPTETGYHVAASALQPEALAALGQMALTWYFFHILFGLGSIIALGLATSEPLPVAEGCGALFFTVALFLSWLWKRRFRHGPLEWVMRQVAG